MNWFDSIWLSCCRHNFITTELQLQPVTNPPSSSNYQPPINILQRPDNGNTMNERMKQNDRKHQRHSFDLIWIKLKTNHSSILHYFTIFCLRFNCKITLIIHNYSQWTTNTSNFNHRRNNIIIICYVTWHWNRKHCKTTRALHYD